MTWVSQNASGVVRRAHDVRNLDLPSLRVKHYLQLALGAELQIPDADERSKIVSELMRAALIGSLPIIALAYMAVLLFYVVFSAIGAIEALSIWAISLAGCCGFYAFVMYMTWRSMKANRARIRRHLLLTVPVALACGLHWGAFPSVVAPTHPEMHLVGAMSLSVAILVSVGLAEGMPLVGAAYLIGTVVGPVVAYVRGELNSLLYLGAVVGWASVWLFIHGLRFVTIIENARRTYVLDRQSAVISILLREFEDGASDWLWETNDTGRLTHVAGRMVQILGVSEAELVFRPLLELVQPRTDGRESLRSLLDQRAEFSRLDVCVDRYVWRLTGRPQFDSRGQFRGYVGVASDVTRERRILELQREASKFGSLAKLSAGIAHDFNNILNTITAYFEIIQLPTNRRRETARYTELGILQCQRAADITTQLLTYARSELLAPEVLRLSDVFDEVVRDVRATHRDPSLSIEVGSASDAYVECDQTHLLRALRNVLENSVRAVRSGGVIKISIDTMSIPLSDHTGFVAPVNLTPGAYVRISVTDGGGGFDESALSYVFDPFFSTHRKSGGSGLGLSVVLGFARQAQGDAVAYNRGRTAVVDIWLPVSARVRADAKDVKVVRRLTENMSKLSPNLSVMVIEDEADFAAIISERLRAEGCTVINVDSLEAARTSIVRVRSANVDVVLCDFMLGDGRGDEVVQLMRSEGIFAPVVYMTGWVQGGQVDEELLRTARVIRKPFEFGQLVAAFEGAIEGTIEGAIEGAIDKLE